MRIIILLVWLICSSFIGEGQTFCNTVDTSCSKKKLLPKNGEMNAWGGEDIMKLNAFISEIDQLYDKMNRSCELDIVESIFLIKTMNTLYFCIPEYADSLFAKCPNLKNVVKLFNEVYQDAFRCQYHCYWGTGGGIYYDELGIIYTGSITACGKVIVKLPLQNGNDNYFPMRNILKYLNEENTKDSFK